MARRPLPEAADIAEALWEEIRAYGISITVGEQVTVTRHLARTGRQVAGADVTLAFAQSGLRKPPHGFASAVAARIKRLAPQA